MANPQPNDSHLRIAHSIQEEIMMRDFTKRQRSILDFLLRLSWGCGKKTAIIPRQKDFELVGVSETKIKAELKWLINARVITWDKNTLQFSFNKDYDQWKVSIVPGYDKERLASLVHMNLVDDTSQISKNTSQNGNFPKWEELDEKESENFPKKQVFEPATSSVTSSDGMSITSIIKSNTSTKSKTNKFFDAGSPPFRLAAQLRTGILNNLPTAKVPNDTELQKWAAIIDLMIRKDSRSEEEISAVISFSVKDPFWSTNVLSASSLRKQFDRLTLKMKTSGNYKNPGQVVSHNAAYQQINKALYEGVYSFDGAE